MNRFRNFLYWLARLLGDINAVLKGKISQRIGRRIIGKVVGRFLGKVFR